MAYRIQNTPGVGSLALFSGLGIDFDLGPIDAAISDASSATDFNLDTSLDFSATDKLIDNMFSPSGKKQDLLNLNIFGTDSSKETNLWDKYGKQMSTQLANTAIKSLSNVAGAALKKAIPPLPTSLQSNLPAFAMAKQVRDAQLNTQIQGLQVHVQNQIKKAQEMQQKIQQARTAADRDLQQKLLQLQQKKLAVARAMRDITKDNKTSVINEEIAKKEKYKNIAIGAGLATLLSLVIMQFSKRR